MTLKSRSRSQSTKRTKRPEAVSSLDFRPDVRVAPDGGLRGWVTPPPRPGGMDPSRSRRRHAGSCGLWRPSRSWGSSSFCRRASQYRRPDVGSWACASIGPSTRFRSRVLGGSNRAETGRGRDRGGGGVWGNCPEAGDGPNSDLRPALSPSPSPCPFPQSPSPSPPALPPLGSDLRAETYIAKDDRVSFQVSENTGEGCGDVIDELLRLGPGPEGPA